MSLKEEIIQEASRLGFADIGFTDAASFDAQKDYLLAHQDEYGWTENMEMNLIAATDPKTLFAQTRSIIVLLFSYFEESFPIPMERHFGRCYLDDDRITKDGLYRQVKAFRTFLTQQGINSKVPYNLPHRLAAARAGLGTFGKNSLFYATRAARGSSFVFTIAVLVDMNFQPDEPTVRIDCPDWCRNACIAACPTRALTGQGRLDPRRCISYLSYYDENITREDLRELMGLWVYGCDRCQNVCPRNAAWITEVKPPNPRVLAKAPGFDLPKLLHMDTGYFNGKIRPHMFYMPEEEIWRWKMNAARAMGNSRNPDYLADLNRALQDNQDPRVKSMCAWAIRLLEERTKR